MPHSSARGVVMMNITEPVSPSENPPGLEALLGNLPGMVYRCRGDRGRVVLFVSEGCRELTGYAPARFFEPKAVNFQQLIHPEDRDAVEKSLRSALKERRAFELRYRIRTATGEERWVSDRGRGVFSSDGAIQFIEGFIADITELKQTEAALREHDTMLSMALSQARDMMLLARVEPGPVFRVQSVNSRYLDVLRTAGIVVTAEQLTGKAFSELRSILPFPEPTWDVIMSRFRTAVETRIPLHYEEVNETARGVFHGQSTIAPICDDAGACRFVLYTSTDVTGSKRAEAALRESEQKFAKAFHASPGAMAISELGGRGFLEVNDGYMRMFGYSREELIGRRSVDLGLWARPEERERFLAALARDGSVSEMEVVRRRRDGVEMISLLSAEPLDFGGRRCLITALYDITDRKRAEAALRESEEKFAKAFHASPGAMAIMEPGGRGFIEVNDRYVQMFGFAREELIGRSITELGLWGSDDERTKAAQALKVTSGVRDMEVIRRRRDGSLITCLLSAEPIELGGRACILSSLYDITARRQAEQALRDSEERFSKAFRAVPDAVFITELESGRIVDVNEGCQHVYGHSREECLGRTTTELGMWNDPADRERALELLAAGGGALRNLETLGRRRTGEQVQVLISCETIELEGRRHLVTIAHEITEQKRAEQALRDSEAKFAQAFRASPGAMGISELETSRFVEVNDAYCRLFGYAREEIVSNSCVELGMWANLEERAKFMEEFLANGRVEDMEIVARRRDGVLMTCVLRAEKVELGGRPHIVSSLNDITARRRSELERTTLEAQLRQTQKLEALGQLAGGIAHDFNNILTGIGAYTELAFLDSERPAQVRKHIAQVKRATDRATDLVRQILTFSRQTAHERRPIRLAVVMREAIKLLRSSLPKTITIAEKLDPVAPIVLANATQIHQVILNLCTNAAHAMADRPGRLTVGLDTVDVDPSGPRARPDLDPGRYARIIVSDTGHGMDEATLARIFEPFFTTKPQGQGTGLGLSVVHGIVEDHDGVITVQSRPGEGTTFEIYLPEERAIDATETEPTPDLPRGKSERILFVDDENAISAGAGELLKILGYSVTTHTDPRAAWTMFAADPNAFDVIITDLTMPHLTGIELTRRVLTVRADIPILLVTGQSVTWTKENLRALGIRALVPKPLSLAKLARSLRDVLDGDG